MTNRADSRRLLGGQADHGRGHHRQRGLVVLADDEQVGPALPAEDDRGRVLDRHRLAQPGLRRGRGRPASSDAASSRASSRFLAMSAGALPSNTISGSRSTRLLAGHCG